MKHQNHVLNSTYFVQGNCIHAQIYPPDDKQFRPLIKEGGVYNLSYFRVRKSGKYKPVDNDHMINFTRWTSVEEVIEIPPAFPMYTYTLTPMEKLRPLAEDFTFFIGIYLYMYIDCRPRKPTQTDFVLPFACTDVIGVVTMLSNVSSVRIKTRQNESLKRTVTICNARSVAHNYTHKLFYDFLHIIFVSCFPVYMAT